MTNWSSAARNRKEKLIKLYKIKTGMTESEIIKIAGSPDEIVPPNPNNPKKEIVYSYYINSYIGGNYNITIDSITGKVLKIYPSD